MFQIFKNNMFICLLYLYIILQGPKFLTLVTSTHSEEFLALHIIWQDQSFLVSFPPRFSCFLSSPLEPLLLLLIILLCVLKISIILWVLTHWYRYGNVFFLFHLYFSLCLAIQLWCINFLLTNVIFVYFYWIFQLICFMKKNF